MAGPLTPYPSEPTIWSAALLEQLDHASVYKQALTNKNYEGEAKIGGTVKMFWFDKPLVKPYTGAWPETEWQELARHGSELQITEADRVLFKLPDIRANFDALDTVRVGTRGAAEAQAAVIDTYISSQHIDIATANQFGTDATPITVGLGASQIKPTVFLTRLKLKLEEAGAPVSDARVVVPSWFAAMLTTQLGSQNIALVGDAAKTISKARDNGNRAEGLAFENLYGFGQIWSSNRVPNTNGTKYKIMAGGNHITFAMAMEASELVKIQNDFAVGYKALMVYGAKLPRAEYMALGTVNEGDFE